MAYRKGQENLIPVTQRPKEEQLELSRKGGIKSGEVRRQKRAAKDLAALVLDAVPDMPEVIKAQIKEMHVVKGKPEARLIAMCAQMRKAMAGDQRSLEFLLGLTGELPDRNGMVPGGYDDSSDDDFDEDHIRRTLDNMTDDQLRNYQELCSMFSKKEAEE